MQTCSRSLPDIVLSGGPAQPAPEFATEPSKYLNNVIKQDNRGIKLRLGPMLGFKRFNNAAITIAGVELLHRIRKSQYNLRRLRLKGATAPAIWNAVLAH